MYVLPARVLMSIATKSVHKINTCTLWLSWRGPPESIGDTAGSHHCWESLELVHPPRSAPLCLRRHEPRCAGSTWRPCQRSSGNGSTTMYRLRPYVKQSWMSHDHIVDREQALQHQNINCSLYQYFLVILQIIKSSPWIFLLQKHCWFTTVFPFDILL